MMISEFYNNFFLSSDDVKIFFSSNFDTHTSELEKKFPIEKPLLVFNYGLVCSNYHWSKQVPYFSKRGYPILLHDYRGHFASSMPHEGISSITFEIIARDIFELTQYILLSSKRKVVILGHSMGVNVTLEFAKNFPTYVSGLVLISGSVISPESLMFDSRIMEIIFPIVESLFKSNPEFGLKFWKLNAKSSIVQRAIRQGGFHPDRVPLSFIKLYLEKIVELGPALFFWLFGLMHKHDIISSLQLINTKTLVISGERDKVIPNYSQGILSKALNNSEFYLVKEGSHVPQIDFPSNINDRINFFLKQVSQ